MPSEIDDGADQIVANPDAVAGYLVRHYEVTPEDAVKLCVENVEIIEQAQRMRAFPYWAGDKIAALEVKNENNEVVKPRLRAKEDN